jgi:hypothetical protein
MLEITKVKETLYPLDGTKERYVTHFDNEISREKTLPRFSAIITKEELYSAAFLRDKATSRETKPS